MKAGGWWWGGASSLLTVSYRYDHHTPQQKGKGNWKWRENVLLLLLLLLLVCLLPSEGGQGRHAAGRPGRSGGSFLFTWPPLSTSETDSPGALVAQRGAPPGGATPPLAAPPPPPPLRPPNAPFHAITPARHLPERLC